MSKLTLSVDSKVAERAKRYAKRRGISVSQMVETYLDSVSSQNAKDEEEDPPILRSLRGSLKGTNVNDYYKYLEEKYK
jgi:hypothetical protein